jgi:hypothetical protein
MINPLTDEDTARQAIRTSLAKELNDTAEMLQFGRGLPQLIHPDVHAELEGSLIAPLALFVKAGMSFWGARMLCENALDRTAAPVVRSMFETFLTIAFLLRRDVSLRHFSKGVETHVDLLGEKLTPEFRMAMYATWCVVKDEQAIERMQYVPELAPGGDELSRRLATIGRTAHVATVGPEWEKRLRKNNTCAGVSIADLAYSMGHAVLYGTLYWKASGSVHQSDAMEYLDFDDAVKAFAPRWCTSIQQIRRTLHNAATVYWLCLVELHDRLQIDVGPQVKDFESRLRAWELSVVQPPQA